MTVCPYEDRKLTGFPEGERKIGGVFLIRAGRRCNVRGNKSCIDYSEFSRRNDPDDWEWFAGDAGCTAGSKPFCDNQLEKHVRTGCTRKNG